jgi:protein TonB
VKEEMKVDTSAKEPEYAYGAGEGVVGGVVGALPVPPAPSIEDAPAYATAGFKKPQMEMAGCVQRSMRVSEDLLDAVGSAPVTVKFAILKDGTPSRFEIMSANKDHRLANVIWTAIKGCQWHPGADAQGRATNIWVIMPFRFAQ